MCLDTQTAHLKAVSNLSTAQFLAVFRSFTSRRGIPLTIHSYCGTNFVGADSEMRKLFTNAFDFSVKIAEILSNDGTT